MCFRKLLQELLEFSFDCLFYIDRVRVDFFSSRWKCHLQYETGDKAFGVLSHDLFKKKSGHHWSKAVVEVGSRESPARKDRIYLEFHP